MTHSLRRAAPPDSDVLYAIHVAAMRDYVEQTWGWDDAQQKFFSDGGVFDQLYNPS